MGRNAFFDVILRAHWLLVVLWAWSCRTLANPLQLCDVDALRCDVICSFPQLEEQCLRCANRRPMRFGKRSGGGESTTSPMSELLVRKRGTWFAAVGGGGEGGRRKGGGRGGGGGGGGGAEGKVIGLEAGPGNKGLTDILRPHFVISKILLRNSFGKKLAVSEGVDGENQISEGRKARVSDGVMDERNRMMPDKEKLSRVDDGNWIYERNLMRRGGTQLTDGDEEMELTEGDEGTEWTDGDEGNWMEPGVGEMNLDKPQLTSPFLDIPHGAWVYRREQRRRHSAEGPYASVEDLSQNPSLKAVESSKPSLTFWPQHAPEGKVFYKYPLVVDDRSRRPPHALQDRTIPLPLNGDSTETRPLTIHSDYSSTRPLTRRSRRTHHHHHLETGYVPPRLTGTRPLADDYTRRAPSTVSRPKSIRSTSTDPSLDPDDTNLILSPSTRHMNTDSLQNPIMSSISSWPISMSSPDRMTARRRRRRKRRVSVVQEVVEELMGMLDLGVLPVDPKLYGCYDFPYQVLQKLVD
ncbi:hypothetical protein Pcinc_039706 [Petrolisthes cinctipes]|uniref:Uncharacterized protein n=1 Tax=Petrolisthes cinctipes TaxID=88211 RepID=A0AAE1BP96_PETCI|nr:hypothetical protein Pcinc_039706 [Petrolisthes cinctipes]